MNLLNIIKNNLFIQNLAGNIISLIPAYLEFTVSKYLAIKKAILITALDDTRGSYLEFGVFTGSSFNYAMKVNKRIEKLGYKCTELSKYTGFKEMLDGRVKTLHPKIHAGILHDRQNKQLLHKRCGRRRTQVGSWVTKPHSFPWI